MAFLYARLASAGSALLVLTSGCSSSDPATTPTDAGADTNTPWGAPFADPTADPVPDGLAPVVVLDSSKTEVAPDFSCLGKPQVVNQGTPADVLVHLIVIGTDDSERIEGAQVDVFTSNKVSGTPDLTPTSATGTSATDPLRGTFTIKVGKEWFGLHAPATATSYEIFSQDIHTDSPHAIAYVAEKGTVDAIHSLMRGTSAYDPNTGMLVVRAADCLNRPLTNVIMHLEVGGELVLPATKGSGKVVRSYFAEAEFPESTRKWTSHSGVAVFVGVPLGKPVRVAARGRKTAGGAIEYFGVRTEKVADMAVTTSRVLPSVTVDP